MNGCRHPFLLPTALCGLLQTRKRVPLAPSTAACMSNASILPCYSGIEIVLECGGQYAGSCDHTTGSCVCRNGFSGRSDYTFTADLRPWGGRVLNCPVHLPTLRVIYAIIATVALILCIFQGAWVLPQTIRVYRKHLHRGRRRRTPLQVQLSVMMAFVLLSAIGIMKASDAAAERTLLGIHEPISSLVSGFVLCLFTATLLDFNFRRDAFLKKGLFLRGTPSAEISRQLTIARWRFRIVFLVIGVTYTFPNTVLARFHPSGDSTLLPFSEGRFLLQPGSSVLTIVALLFWRRELRRWLVMIDDLFTRLARWTSTSATHSFANPSSSEAASSNPSATANKDGAIASSKPAFTRAASQNTTAALKKLKIGRNKLENYYKLTRRTIATNCVGLTVVLVVPPLWATMSWIQPFYYLLPLPSILTAIATYTPSAFRGALGEQIEKRKTDASFLGARRVTAVLSAAVRRIHPEPEVALSSTEAHSE